MVENPTPQPVPWTIFDTWIGVILFVVIDVALLFILYFSPEPEFVQSAALVAIQLAYLLPVATIFLWRPSGWKFIGFRKFTWASVGLGCGFLIGSYLFVYLHNAILLHFHIETQGDMLMELFSLLDTAVWFIIVGIFLAPFVEEIFFRGFLFQGFRNRMGWLKAALLSSAIFAISHLDPVSLFPTFVLGFTFSYIFHRSNSIWPGMILHFTVNSFALCLVLVATQFPIPYP